MGLKCYSCKPSYLDGSLHVTLCDEHQAEYELSPYSKVYYETTWHAFAEAPRHVPYGGLPHDRDTRVNVLVFLGISKAPDPAEGMPPVELVTEWIEHNDGAGVPTTDIEQLSIFVHHARMWGVTPQDWARYRSLRLKEPWQAAVAKHSGRTAAEIKELGSNHFGSTTLWAGTIAVATQLSTLAQLREGSDPKWTAVNGAVPDYATDEHYLTWYKNGWNSVKLYLYWSDVFTDSRVAAQWREVSDGAKPWEASKLAGSLAGDHIPPDQRVSSLHLAEVMDRVQYSGPSFAFAVHILLLWRHKYPHVEWEEFLIYVPLTKLNLTPSLDGNSCVPISNPSKSIVIMRGAFLDWVLDRYLHLKLSSLAVGALIRQSISATQGERLIAAGMINAIDIAQWCYSLDVKSEVQDLSPESGRELVDQIVKWWSMGFTVEIAEEAIKASQK